MKPIRLAEAIAVFARKDLYGFQESTWAFIDAITGGDIVTPADEALASIRRPYELLDISEDGQVWKCPICGRHLSGETLDELDDGVSDPAIMHRHDCAWVAARRKVAALEGQ